MAEDRADITILALAARTATTNSALFATPATAKGMYIFFECTALTATPSVTMTLSYQDNEAGASVFVPLFTSAAITTVSKKVFCFAPGADATGSAIDAAVSLPMPFDWRITVTHADADSMTYRVTAHYTR